MFAKTPIPRALLVPLGAIAVMCVVSSAQAQFDLNPLLPLFNPPFQQGPPPIRTDSMQATPNVQPNNPFPGNRGGNQPAIRPEDVLRLIPQFFDDNNGTDGSYYDSSPNPSRPSHGRFVPGNYGPGEYQQGFRVADQAAPPLTPADFDAMSYGELGTLLRSSARRIEQRMDRISTGAGWKNYLRTDELARVFSTEQLADPDEPTRNVLAEILTRYEQTQQQERYQAVSDNEAYKHVVMALRQYGRDPVERSASQTSNNVLRLATALDRISTGEGWKKFLRTDDLAIASNDVASTATDANGVLTLVESPSGESASSDAGKTLTLVDEPSNASDVPSPNDVLLAIRNRLDESNETNANEILREIKERVNGQTPSSNDVLRAIKERVDASNESNANDILREIKERMSEQAPSRNDVLRDIKKRFDDTQRNPGFSMIARMPEFQATHVALSQTITAIGKRKSAGGVARLDPQPEQPGRSAEGILKLDPQPEQPGRSAAGTLKLNPQPDVPGGKSALERVGLNPQPEPPSKETRMLSIDVNSPEGKALLRKRDALIVGPAAKDVAENPIQAFNGPADLAAQAVPHAETATSSSKGRSFPVVTAVGCAGIAKNVGGQVAPSGRIATLTVYSQGVAIAVKSEIVPELAPGGEFRVEMILTADEFHSAETVTFTIAPGDGNASNDSALIGDPLREADETTGAAGASRSSP